MRPQRFDPPQKTALGKTPAAGVRLLNFCSHPAMRIQR
jgi:hypothetical protein